jgi:two-component system, response regulator, stage 0 sporulation protein F
MDRILIVDDDQRIVQLLGDCFKHAYVVEVAMNAGEALTIVRRERPDLVLLDVMLPGVSGRRLLRDSKRVDSTIAVIMVTGSGNVALAAEAVENGAAVFCGNLSILAISTAWLSKSSRSREPAMLGRATRLTDAGSAA